MPSTVQPASTAAWKLTGVLVIGLILTSAAAMPAARAQDAVPPRNLAQLIAHRETETEAERNEYMYRQTVTIQELDERGMIRGEYHEVRDVIFSPRHERSEEPVGKVRNTLQRLLLTPEDFHDIRDIQPMVLTEDKLWNYETRARGDEVVDGIDCWLLQVRPRQILAGMRLLDGLVWADKKEYNIVRMEGRAVPEIRTTKSENLFPRFITVRKPMDGKHWFPVMTYADDVLEFRAGPQRERLEIEYSNYKRFSAESTFTPK